ncbi:MAG: glucose-6-phosphate isomerase, partial [Acutalibacteraceae bacterium]
MSTHLNGSYLGDFVSEESILAMQEEVTKAHELLHTKTGEGNEFLGWLTLPTDYDKDEFSRIKKAATKIQQTSDLLIVIGIGGSYLG